MFYPDFKSLSDEALLEKISELSKRIMFFGYSKNGAYESLSAMLEAYREEYKERQFMEYWRLYGAGASKTIETEPDLRKDSKQESDLKREKQKRKRIDIPVRTDKPVIPDKDA